MPVYKFPFKVSFCEKVNNKSCSLINFSTKLAKLLWKIHYKKNELPCNDNGDIEAKHKGDRDEVSKGLAVEGDLLKMFLEITS